jgi:RecB family exonuclease
VTEFDIPAAVNDAWHKEVSSRVADSGVPPEHWRAAGRKSKDWPDKENGDFWQAKAPELVQAYIDWRKLQTNFTIWQPEPGLPAIELGATVPIGGVMVKAYMDRIFEVPDGDTTELVVLDLKTGSRKPDSDLQLGFYACVTEVAYGRRPKWGTYWHARDGNMLPLVDLSHYSLELLGSLLADYKRARDNGIYLPQPGGNCNNCGVRRACAIKNGDEAHLYDPAHPKYGRNTE